ncbi:amidohydrolase [Desulfonema ishimotonii]|uniref:Amidohydrolase n=1 Tax=Desulfonema ishimotonii TaxID=45657 RepID=A0A401FY80_9BACT|nr:M20 family metallopeptidase [Desulfonema ishimotonii]GBC61927.1 amidohydrolase [Desulfonema ishimotonii]
MSYPFKTSFYDWLVTLRRQLHQIPEKAYAEKKTAALICKTLDALGVSYQDGIGKTGVVARLRAKQDGPVIAFRADMDALPITEANDLPYASRHSGWMHACGHDAHVSIALGVIRWLQEKEWQEKGAGEILFIFQPAEEDGAGADAMLETGFFDDEPVQAIFAGHMDPELHLGHVGIPPRVSHAATNAFILDIRGKGGHGAHPDQCCDPIVAGAHLVTQVQTLISREISPIDSGVVTIGSFQAGSATNIIPETARIKGTIRTLSQPNREKILRRFQEMLKGIEISFGAEIDLGMGDGYPVLENDPGVTAYGREFARRVLGEAYVHMRPPCMGGEDFSYFCRRWKGAMFHIGCRNPEEEFRFGLHSQFFKLDERVLDAGTAFFGEMLMDYSSHSESAGE